ncbi:hypothetical protein AWH56_020395 [Anaerobacillus isosaccharinicus]|uniref:Uncharacterized protein n=1 Tax=Anaerobacillus isosaccharinicus TaxID=1532552 RepID=A0A1S2KZ92_9BACI|nr:hypothetical protein [Anaerobacillus isosaccharinicus]MBA5586732.1 hypothetical protein [Anaerobacillus isosaccharinicus]QOY35046.1 hypothetical protein AWH56_020395 [Anaerobacillus isosaccharinicus]
MPNFERVKKLSNFLFGVSSFFVFLLIINYMKDPYQEVYPSTFFIFAVGSLTLGISLRFVAKDAKEYIDRTVKFNK